MRASFGGLGRRWPRVEEDDEEDDTATGRDIGRWRENVRFCRELTMTFPRANGLMTAMHHPGPSPASAPIVITVAPVNYGDPASFPTLEDLARDISESAAAGASVVHFHVTDAAGRAT